MKRNLLATTLAPLFALGMNSCDMKKDDNTNDSSSTATSAVVYTAPPRLIRDDGAYELLALIEGVEPNKQFVSNLQLVTKQRVELKRLLDESGGAEKNAEAIKTLESKLKENVGVMAKSYGYTLDTSFLYMPIESSLMKTGEDGKKSSVREIDSPSEYDRLQAMRTKYVAARKAGSEKEEKDLAMQLMKSFGFNVKLNYTLDVRRSALYRKIR